MSDEQKSWRCFFCDEVFTDPEDAHEHFGNDDIEFVGPPGCIDPLRTDEKERLKQLHDAETHAMKMQRDAEEAENDASMYHIYQSEIERLFGNCGGLPARTPHQAWLKFEAVRNERDDAQAKLLAIRLVIEPVIKSLDEIVQRMEMTQPPIPLANNPRVQSAIRLANEKGAILRAQIDAARAELNGGAA